VGLVHRCPGPPGGRVPRASIIVGQLRRAVRSGAGKGRSFSSGGGGAGAVFIQRSSSQPGKRSRRPLERTLSPLAGYRAPAASLRLARGRALCEAAEPSRGAASVRKGGPYPPNNSSPPLSGEGRRARPAADNPPRSAPGRAVAVVVFPWSIPPAGRTASDGQLRRGVAWLENQPRGCSAPRAAGPVAARRTWPLVELALPGNRTV